MEIDSITRKVPALVDEKLNPSDTNMDDMGAAKIEELESHEVFRKGVDGVEFRTVSWQKATLLFVKIEFAMSILAIPAALGALGAVGGGLSIIAWTTLNTCGFFMLI